MVTAVVVANNFILRALKENIELTPMKLQKLIYFLYKNYLKTTDERLFTELFEVWQYGPVLTSVYDEFKCFGSKSIDRFARDSMGDVYTVSEVEPFKQCFEITWNTYKNYDAWTLSMLTHKTGSAWKKAYDAKEYYLSDEDIKNEL
jgi:uncharacterized phage-associated protein